ncbi:MAG: DUF4367 domain-containing protein [Oscillibacter sp.]|nr:DUF4367 domain-containing protein [Oscillibacter sp.]
MTDKELDRLMRRVLLDSMDLREDAAGFVPSARHRREMRAMLKDPAGWARRRAQPVWKRGLRHAAAILLVCTLGLGGAVLASPTVHAAVLRWATEWYEEQVIYRYGGEAISGEMPQYAITALPDGYAEDVNERIDWPTYIGIKYRNEEQQTMLLFNYIYMQQGSASSFEFEEDTTILPVTVNGLKGTLFLKNDWEKEWNVITWIDPDSNLQFGVYGNLNETDILTIAESVSLVENDK